MATLCRLTGATIHHVLWEMRYAAGLGLMHADGVFHGGKYRFRVREDEGDGMADEFRKWKLTRGP